MDTAMLVDKPSGMAGKGMGQDVTWFEELNHLRENAICIHVVGTRFRQGPELAKMHVDWQLSCLANTCCQAHDVESPAGKTADFGMRLNALNQIGVVMCRATVASTLIQSGRYSAG
jgi:hypothetical protein